MTVRKILLVYKKRDFAYRKVCAILKKDLWFKSVYVVDLQEKDFEEINLVISLGGDGTFLRTSHFIKNETPILGVNTDPKMKEGFYCSATIDQFEKDFLHKSFKIIKYNRLESSINDRPIPELALNELFIGEHKPYKMSRYVLMGEFQKSSGVLVAAAAGTHGWLRSAGGKPLSKDSKKFQYIVMSPYTGKLTQPRFTNSIMNENETFVLGSKMDRGIIVIDSLSIEHRFSFGSILKVKLSDKPLNVVQFS